jgi:thymidylate kinase
MMTRMKGVFVAVVGPDGVGKTTFARGLVAALGDGVRYFHFRPPVRAELATVVLDPTPLPKRKDRPSHVGGWARIAVAVVRFWAGYIVSMSPALRNGEVVIGDRWSYGYLVQPVSVGFAGPRWLARLAVSLMPTPDVVFNLAAPASVILERKAELTREEVEFELEVLPRLPAPVVTLDATREPATLVAEALEVIGR